MFFFLIYFFNVANSADPNRPGMHMKLIKFLLKLKAPHIVYVSCNPATCARDLDYLCHGVVRIVVILNLLCLKLAVVLTLEISRAGRSKHKGML